MNPNLNVEGIGQRIRLHRVNSLLNVREFAEKIELTPRYIEAIERGEKAPKLDTFVKILNVLEVSADDVLQDSLIVGYKDKASYLQTLIDNLSPTERYQVLTVVSTMIESFKFK